MADVGQSQMKI